MANYRWTDFIENSFYERYPRDVSGYNIWRDQPQIIGSRSWNEYNLVGRIEDFSKPRLLHPKIFISHRRSDSHYAERVAYLACKSGFEYWLDIYDPILPTASSGLAIASIIEMALLNCSHVIAIYTLNTKGSEWVPYEYGRIKIFKLLSSNIACWIHKDIDTLNIDTPDYFDLGVKTKTEFDIESWLIIERGDFYKKSNTGIFKNPCVWGSTPPTPLPT